MKISSSSSLWRKAVLTSIWTNSRSNLATVVSIARSEANLTTGKKGFFVVNTLSLGITICNESCLIPFDRTIQIEFDLENPLVLNGLTPSQKAHQVPDLVCPHRLYLLSHFFFPFTSIRQRQGLFIGQ